MTKKFFVYGTLKVGGFFAEQLDHIRKSVRSASLTGFDLFGVTDGPGRDPRFPAAVKGEGKIEGEIHEFTDDTQALSIIDTIEGYDDRDLKNSYYLRKEVEVDLKTGGTETAFIYLFNREIKKFYPRMKEWKI
jgi:gamma-glutamylcyclotransferase (GGCT)/AIG2-like uncharacterized protein YtfP